MTRAVNRVGQVFERLEVIGAKGRNADGQRLWECLCTCGGKTIVTNANLVSGGTRSCGCLKRYSTIVRNTTHGEARKGSRTPEYTTWIGMIQRCENPNTIGYENYGGRGITVCKEWRDSYETFIRDMGPRPSGGHSIERIDNDGPYNRDNCTWATKAVQLTNQRRTVMVTYQGKRMALTDAARLSGVSDKTVKTRRAAGWPEAEWFLTGDQRAERSGRPRRHGEALPPRAPVPCACGCGELVIDDGAPGRPRLFINDTHKSRAMSRRARASPTPTLFE